MKFTINGEQVQELHWLPRRPGRFQEYEFYLPAGRIFERDGIRVIQRYFIGRYDENGLAVLFEVSDRY